jgi:hypothetical protein
MSVNYIPLESKSGFKSPGFLVDEIGNLTVNGSIDTLGSFKINGIPIIDASDSVIGLDPIIERALGIRELGTLDYLTIDGDLTVSQGSTPYISIVNGIISMFSSSDVGSIDNCDIGLREPADGNFKSLNVGPGDSQGELSVQGNLVVTIGDVYIDNTPTQATHATNKSYVDARVSAFAIAFGA